MKSNLKYIIEGLVIIFSVFLSFYFEDIRKGKEDFNTKNELVNDLILSLDDDLTQIDNLINILQNSEKYITEILNDIDSNHKNISDIEAIKMNRIRVSNPMKIALLTKSYFDYKMNLI